jgi:ribosome biogenesis GTPase A
MELEQAIKIVKEYQKLQKGENHDYLYTRNERIEAIDKLLEITDAFNIMGTFVKFLNTPTILPTP